jgi:hypothetical protein
LILPKRSASKPPASMRIGVALDGCVALFTSGGPAGLRASRTSP